MTEAFLGYLSLSRNVLGVCTVILVITAQATCFGMHSDIYVLIQVQWFIELNVTDSDLYYWHHGGKNGQMDYKR